ncbi:MAG: hypothetical protein ACK4TA_24265 [Saprospiraceae bacterium]
MKKLNVCLLALTLVGWLSFTSCDSNGRPNNDTPVENPNDNIMGDQGDATEYEDERAELRDDIQEAQQDIDERITDLREEAKNASADAKVEINQQIERLEAKRIQLAADLDRLGEDMGDGWESFKMNVRKSLDDLEDELDDDNNGM